jgi:predicted TIM-barrel fold metal-dependent hydrolase
VNISLFDCNAGVGKTGLAYPAAERPAEFLAVMDHYGIDEALVYDLTDLETGRFDDPSTILAFCAHSERLHPTVMVVPPETGEQPPPDAWVEQLLAAGIKAVRAYPSWHRFDFLPYCMGSLLEVLQAHRVPVFVTYYVPKAHPWEHTPEWDHVHRTALAYPDLPIVVLYTGMLQQRRMLPLLARCPNVRLDTISSTFAFLEFVSQRFGPERLVIGTRYPKYEPGLHVSWPRYADLDERARALIAGDNVRAMLEAVR